MDPNLSNPNLNNSANTKVSNSPVQANNSDDNKKISKKLIIFATIVFILVLAILLFILSSTFRNLIYHKQSVGIRFYEIAENKSETNTTNKLFIANTIDLNCQDQTFLLSFKISSEKKLIDPSYGSWNTICVDNKYQKDGSTWLPKPFTQTHGILSKTTVSDLSNPSENELEKFYVDNFWGKYPNIVGTPTGDGRVFNIPEQPSGISLLGKNYKEGMKNITIDITDLKGNIEKDTLLTNVYQFTSIKAIPDYNKKGIWFVVNPSNYSCSSNQSAPSCSYSLNYFDLTTKKVTTVHTFPYDPTLILAPLIISPKDEVVVYESYTDQTKASQDGLISYNPDDKTVKPLGQNVIVNRNRNVGRDYESDRVADYDNNGNLYIVTSQETTYISRIIKISLDGTTSFINFDNKTNPGYDTQITIDKENNIIYAVNVTWDGNNQSVLNVYDLTNGQNIESNQITQNQEDVRGIYAVNGILMAGYSKGLGLYSLKEKSWKFITETNGLLDTSVRDVIQLDKNTICLTHETKGMSCSKGSMDLYYSLVNAPQTAGNKLNPTPPPTVFNFKAFPITDQSKWKIYQDASYSLEYPIGWDVSSQKPDKYEFVSFTNNSYKKDPPRLTASFDPSLENPLEDGLSFAGPNTFYKNVSQVFTVNDYEGVATWFTANGITAINIYIKNPRGGILSIQAQNIEVDTLNKIISSVSFK